MTAWSKIQSLYSKMVLFKYSIVTNTWLKIRWLFSLLVTLLPYSLPWLLLLHTDNNWITHDKKLNVIFTVVAFMPGVHGIRLLLTTKDMIILYLFFVHIIYGHNIYYIYVLYIVQNHQLHYIYELEVCCKKIISSCVG